MIDPTPAPCRAVGYVVSDGRKVALVRCERDAGHVEPKLCGTCSQPACRASRPGTPHAVTFEWRDDEAMLADWPGAYDPDEAVDVEVPELSADELAAIERDLETDRAVDGERQARSDARQALEDRVSVRLAAMTDDELEAIARDADTDALIDAHRERRAFGDD